MVSLKQKITGINIIPVLYCSSHEASSRLHYFVDPRGAARRAQMLRFYSKRRGTLQYVYSAANASTGKYDPRVNMP